MAEFNYTEPVSQLLKLGDVRGKREWLDYSSLGLTTDHIPDLIRIALDEDLLWADSDTDDVWVTLHAWRALGQLRAAEAVEPLLTLFDFLDDDIDDWISADLPRALGLIGPDAIPPLRDFLADPEHGQWACVAASNSLVKIAERYPATRAEVVDIISGKLEHFAEQGRQLNACLVANLAMDLHAVETAPIIEQAFAADAVDLSFVGDWEAVQIELGLLEARLTPEPDYFAIEMPEFANTGDALRAFADQRSQPAPLPPRKKPGRNEPCWCGSGKKYKQCHMQEDREKGL